MKAERTYKKQTPRTIIQKVPRKTNAGNMRHPNGRLAASRILRSNIYKNKRSQYKPMFAHWGLGREAQHIIPYAVCLKYGINENLINDACNGIMLPSGRKGTNKRYSEQILSRTLYYFKRNKNFIRASHIKKGIAHKNYNTVVHNFLEILQQHGVDIKLNFKKIALTIRLATKQLDETQAVDDLKLHTIIATWNLWKNEKNVEVLSQKLTRKGKPSKHWHFGSSFVAQNSIMTQMKRNKGRIMVDNRSTCKQQNFQYNSTGLPDNLKAGIENLTGFSMDNVRVHYASNKPAAFQAYAYTQGTDIYVAPGQERHLPHEAWHVAQQMAGRVAPTTEINGMPVNDNAALEHEADVMGAKANSY